MLDDQIRIRSLPVIDSFRCAGASTFLYVMRRTAIDIDKCPVPVTTPTLLPNLVASLALAFRRHAKVDEAEPAGWPPQHVPHSEVVMMPPLLVYHIQNRFLNDRPMQSVSSSGHIYHIEETFDEPICFCELRYWFSFIGNDEKRLVIIDTPPLGVEGGDGGA